MRLSIIIIIIQKIENNNIVIIVSGVFGVVQDNVFVQLLCSIQYRVVKENADDAFYELQNPQEQIQAYVFDGCVVFFLRVPLFRNVVN